MKLKPEMDLEAFFDAVRRCAGSVYFQTAQDDRLNLKSALCCYLFTAAWQGNGLELDGELVFTDADDQALLRPFYEE